MIQHFLTQLTIQGYRIATTVMGHSNIYLFDNTWINVQPSIDKILFYTSVEGQIHQRFTVPNIPNSENRSAISNKLTEWISFYNQKELATQYLQELMQKGYAIAKTKLYQYTLRLSKENSLLINLDNIPKAFSLSIYQKKSQTQFNDFEDLAELKFMLETILVDYHFTVKNFDQLLADFKNQGYPITTKAETYHIKLPNTIELKAELTEGICYIYFFAEQQLKMIRQALTSGDFYTLTTDFCKEYKIFLII